MRTDHRPYSGFLSTFTENFFKLIIFVIHRGLYTLNQFDSTQKILRYMMPLSSEEDGENKLLNQLKNMEGYLHLTRGPCDIC